MRLPSLASAALLLLSGVATAAPAADLTEARELARAGKTDAAVEAARIVASTARDDAAPGRFIQDLLRAEGRHAELDAQTPSDVSLKVASLLNARVQPPERAEAALKALVGDDSAPPQARLDLAIVCLELGKVRTAQTEVTAYVEAHPDDAEGHYVLGRVRVASGKSPAAESPLARALELAPAWAPAVVLYSEVLRDVLRGDEARSVLEDALGRYPKNAWLVRGLAADQVAAGEPAEAEKTLGRLVGLRPQDGSVFASLADVQRSLGKLAEAEKNAIKGVELSPESAAPHRSLGLVLERKDDFEGALVSFERAAALRPEWAQGHIDVGIVLSLLDDYAGAQAALEKAIKLDKKSLDAHFRLAQVHYFADDLKDAKKAAGVALKTDGDHVPTNRLMGRILLAEGKGKQAMKFFEKAAKTDPTDSDSVRMIARCWMSLGKHEEALAALDRAFERNDQDPWVSFDYGKVLEEKEDWDGAEEAFRDAIKLAPKKAVFHLYLAELLDEVLDDPEGALELYEKYIELGGDDSDGEVASRIEQLKN